MRFPTPSVGHPRIVTVVDLDGSQGDTSSSQETHRRGPQLGKMRFDDIRPNARKTVPLPSRGGLAAEEAPKKVIARDSEHMRKIFQMLRWHPLKPGYHGWVPLIRQLPP